MEQSTQPKAQYTTAFIAIALSGELFIVRQYKSLTLVGCARWRNKHRKELTQLYGELREVTIQHKNK